MKGLGSTIAVIWRLAYPYFYSEDRRAGRILLTAVIVIELSITAINVMITQWNNRFYNALQNRDWDTFVTELMIFGALAGAFIVLAVYQTYLQQWLQIRMRTWMTKEYLNRWLGGANHYRMQLLGEAADNPDQRISEDIRLFVDRSLFIGLRLFGAVVSLLSFLVLLWTLSDAAPFRIFGYEVAIPGYLVWGALIYAIVGTILTHLIGSPLIGLNFQQQRYEADFRFNLVRVREHSEQIALSRGEPAEAGRLMTRFASVINNWQAIMSRTKRLTMLTSGYRQFALIIPFILVSPAYFAGRVQLGGLMQTASAFDNVREAFSVIIDIYREIAEWRAVVARLDGFDTAMAQAEAAAVAKPTIALIAKPGTSALALDDVTVQLPNGAPLVEAHDVTIAPGDRVLVTGPSGSGKSTTFRAIAGIWPFGSGTVAVPEGARMMMLPQRPYLPIGSLETAVSYPSHPGSFDRGRIADLLTAVGLPALASRVDEEAHWHRTLSPGEQERLAVARALLHAPDFLFLDEATASLDEASEAALYRLLHERLPNATIVSIGHRSTLGAFHDRRLVLGPEQDRFTLREAAVAATR